MRERSVIGCGLISIVAIAGSCGGASGTSGAVWNPPFSGRRAFIASSQVVTDVRSGGQGLTLVVDADRRIAILGGNRTGTKAPLQSAPNGAFRLANPVSLSTRFPGDCPGDSVVYDELELKFDAAGNVTGSGRGQLNIANGDVVSSSTGAISLSGTPDTQRPVVGLYSNGMMGDPFIPFRFSASEPLPLEAGPVFRSTMGEIVTPKASPGDAFAIDFSLPFVLPFEQWYTADIANVTDFAGNRPTADGILEFSSGSPPLLVAADGFESQTDRLLAGTAQFVSAQYFPIISGVRSLYVPPESSNSGYAVTTFALRLAIAPDATVLRFSYRTLSRAAKPGSAATYLVGSVGSPIVTTTLLPNNGTTTSVNIGGAEMELGPLTTATINLPDPAAAEVMLARTVEPPACGRPLPPPGGILIDDLRTE